MASERKPCFSCGDMHTVGVDAVEGYDKTTCLCAWCYKSQNEYWPHGMTMEDDGDE